MKSRRVSNTCLLLALILSLVASAGNASATSSTCVPPPPGMVAWYPGDGNSEDIAGDNDGTLQNGTTFTTGKVAQALSFDGVDDYVPVPDHPSLDPSTAVSVDVWMRASSGSGFQGLVSKFDHLSGSLDDDAYNLAIESGTIRWQIVAGQQDFQLNTPALPIFDGEYHLIAGTYDSVAQRMAIYVDGVEVAARAAHGTIGDVNTPLSLGATKAFGNNGYVFNGQLDEVEIFDRALTATEVLSIYNAGSAGKCKTAAPLACVAPPAGMVAWYPGDNNSEDIAGDNDGTLQDNTTFTSGKVAQALSFDGVDDYVLVPDHPSLDLPTAVSVDVWMSATSGSGFQGLVSKFEHYTHPANDDAYNLSIENGTIRWQIVANGRDFQLNTPVLPIFDGEYHLLAGTYDSTAQRMVIYVDGVEMAAQAAYGTISDVSTPLYLGAAKTYGANNHYFNGQLDEVEIFDRALTPTEIQSIYNAGSAGKCKPIAPSACVAPPAGMVAWYPGDNNSEDIAGDNDGTLQDNTTFTSGKVAQALSFDGVDDYVLVPDHPSLDLPTAVSVDVWMSATSGSGFQGLVSKFEHYTHPANDDAYNLSIENGTIRWQIVANGLDFQLNTAVLPIFDGEYHLLAGTYDSVAQRMVIYVDGVEVAAQAAYGTISDVNTPLYLGAAKTYGANNHYFNGQLDEVEIFDRALTPTEVLSIYNAGSAGKCKDANTPTATATATSTPVATDTPTATSTPVATETPTATSTPVATETPTATSTPVATDTPSPTATATSTPPASVKPLAVFSPGGFSCYVNCPEVRDDLVIFRNDNPPGAHEYRTGVGASSIPMSYQAGDLLKWAVLACSPTGPSTLNIGVQSGSGDESNLSIRQKISVPSSFTWLQSSPTIVDIPKPQAYFWIPGPLGQEIQVEQLVLGHPASVAQYIARYTSQNLGESCVP